ncbi:MAG: hypothetical protein Tsb002_30330 [Wenzhouxiangellaceae bacterium]
MNRYPRTLIIIVMLTLSACASSPRKDLQLERLKAELNQLQQEQAVRDYAPLYLAEAQRAVRRLDQAGRDEAQREHLAYLASRRMDIARAEARRAESAETVIMLEQQKSELLVRSNRLQAEQALREAEQARLLSLAQAEEAERARLQAEAAQQQSEQANAEARQAQEEANQARQLAEAQTKVAELARQEAALASEQAASLQRRLERLQLRQTDRGVVVTLGDVTFATGKAELASDSFRNLESVVELLQSEPERRIRIEGHTDDRGAADVNQRLSEQRANAVRDALVRLGVNAGRVTTLGLGEDFPIADNATEAGRQQNRRVDVILLDDQAP